MEYVYLPKPGSSPDGSIDKHGPAARNYSHHGDHEFVAMLGSYRCSGGLARAQEVLALLKRNCGSDLATLAKWIVKGKVISFEWQSELWLPLFQFNRIDMMPQPGLGHVLAELSAVYDPWELAHWFSQSNAWLADQTPAETLVSDPAAVLHAARADRFVMAG